MTAAEMLVFAQAIGEYGALAGAASALQSLRYHVESALQQPRNVVLVGLGILILAWLLFRRR